MGESVAAGPPLVIAFVNNMPDGALKSAEAQFQGLVREAADGILIQFRNFYLPGIERNEAARFHFAQCYSPLPKLMQSRPDGLIVTGAAPTESAFEREPYWRSFTQLADWAAANEIPTFWSCLAAHAAVKHFDGLERHCMGRKLSGIFDCEKVSDHPVLENVPPGWRVPHSRYNDLREADLVAAGYKVIALLRSGSPDIFVSPRHNLSIFAQGHLEYDLKTLLHEYWRDLGHFRGGRTIISPHPPEGYFEQGVSDAVAGLSGIAGGKSSGALRQVEDLLAQAPISASWRRIAVQIFANWINPLLKRRLHTPVSQAISASLLATPALSATLEGAAK